MKWKETLKTLVAISFFSLVLSFIFREELFVWLAAAILALGLFENPAAEALGRGWMFFSEVLGKISSFIILSAVFYLVLTPTAFLWKLFSREGAKHFFRNSRTSLFENAERAADREYFERPW